MLYFIYSLLFTLALPCLLVRLWLKAKKNSAYRQHWQERFLGKLPYKLDESIWLHAVSLGEMIAAAPLIERLLNYDPHQKLVLTCTTPTGRNEAEKWRKKFPHRVYTSYLPYDVPFALRRAIASIKPRLLIVMETELWPNLFRLAKVPVIIANARISDHAYPKYQRFAFAIRPCFAYVSAVAAQSELDAERFKSLGAKNVSVMGNIKYDLAAPLDAMQKAREIKSQWQERLILCAGSTHEGEESLLLDAYRQLKPDFPKLLLTLIPRHPERFNRVAELVRQKNLELLRRTENKPVRYEDVFLVDAMGEVKTFYALSDLVFVGGSLITLGGHNILEGAILGKAIFVGPHMQNARKVVQEFLAHRALVQLQSTTLRELVTTLHRLLKDSSLRGDLGNHAFTMMQRNKGALQKLLQVIDVHLRSNS